MQAQQLLTHIIKPTLEFMGKRYNTKDAQMLLLSTAAIESKCGYYIKQIGGPALGIWQMEPSTHDDIWENCDAIQFKDFGNTIKSLGSPLPMMHDLTICPAYSCAMARLKYAMDPKALPDRNNMAAVYGYYKRIYNTPMGASTYYKFKQAWELNKLNEVIL